MQNLNQPEAVVQGQNSLTPYHGSVAPPWGDLRDGPVGDRWICPRRREDWQVVPGLVMPRQWLSCDEVSGPLVDRGPQGISYAATGAVTYSQVGRTGSTLPWVGIPSSAGAGFVGPAATGWDPGMPLFVVFDFRIASTGGNRTILTLGPNVLLQANASGFLQLVCTGSTNAVGTHDYRSATVGYRGAVYWEPGDLVGGGPIYKLWTGREQLQITAGTGFAGSIAPAGDGTRGPYGAVAPPPWFCRGLGMWPGWDARRAANLGGARQGGKYVLQQTGVTVAY